MIRPPIFMKAPPRSYPCPGCEVKKRLSAAVSFVNALCGMLQYRWRLCCVGEADMLCQQPSRTNFDVLLARKPGHEKNTRMEGYALFTTMHLVIRR